MARKIRRNDYVKIITGKDKGKIGKVLVIKENSAIVEKTNMQYKHIKGDQNHPNGRILKKEGLIHISNMLYYCKKSSLASKVGFKIVEQKKVRFLKINNVILNEK